jgi:hypothetical protein
MSTPATATAEVSLRQVLDCALEAAEFYEQDIRKGRDPEATRDAALMNLIVRDLRHALKTLDEIEG